MSTLIRVRGKQGNKKRKIAELAAERENSHANVLKEREKQSTRLSYLENLPIEILQNIYILSQNPSFASVSRRLRAQTLSDYTKLRITTACCRAAWLAELEYLDMNHLSTFELLQIPRQQHGFRSLTRQPWFNFPLLQAARCHWLLETAATEIEAGFERANSEASLSLDFKSGIKERLRVFFDEFRRSGSASYDHFPLFAPESELPMTRKSMENILYLEHDEVGVWIGLDSSFPSRRMRSQNRIKHDDPRTCDTLLIRFSNSPDCEQYTFYKPEMGMEHIPPSLFRAPFTQAKGDLLVELLPLRPVDWQVAHPPLRDCHSPTITEAYKLGLEEAINEACIPALIYMIGFGPMRRVESDSSSEFSAVLQGLNLPSFDGDLPIADPLGVIHDQASPYWQMPWTYIRGERRGNAINSEPPALPTTKHLNACILGMERNPNLYVNILDRLRLWDDYETPPALPKSSLNLFYTQKEIAVREYRGRNPELYRNFWERLYSNLCDLPTLVSHS